MKAWLVVDEEMVKDGHLSLGRWAERRLAIEKRTIVTAQFCCSCAILVPHPMGAGSPDLTQTVWRRVVRRWWGDDTSCDHGRGFPNRRPADLRGARVARAPDRGVA